MPTPLCPPAAGSPGKLWGGDVCHPHGSKSFLHCAKGQRLRCGTDLKWPRHTEQHGEWFPATPSLTNTFAREPHRPPGCCRHLDKTHTLACDRQHLGQSPADTTGNPCLYSDRPHTTGNIHVQSRSQVIAASPAGWPFRAELTEP